MRATNIDRKSTVLTDGTVTLRPYRPRDAETVYEAARESLAELHPWMPWAHQDYSLKESRDWIKRRPQEWESGIEYDFAIYDAGDGSFLGGCGISRMDNANRTANLGYWVRSSRTGRGVATAATRLLAGWAFRELQLNRIEIVAAIGNLRSQRVADKARAKCEGLMRSRLLLHGQVHDAVLYSLVPGDLAGPGPAGPPV